MLSSTLLPRMRHLARRSTKSKRCRPISTASTPSSSSPPTPVRPQRPRGLPQLTSCDFSRASDPRPASFGPHRHHDICVRRFSSASEEEEGAKPKKKKDLRESIERMKKESSSGSDEQVDDDPPPPASEPDPRVEKLASLGSTVLSALSDTWTELVASGRAKDINKKLGPPRAGHPGEGGKPNYADDDEAADRYEEYKGSKDVMVVDPKEHLSAWERMERRLRDAPIIQDIFEKSEHIYNESGARTHVQKTQQKIQHLKEDAEEAWETSQNPWVYRASSVYDTLTAESEFAAATRELRVLDPDFALETWKRDVVEHTLPGVMKLFLEGRITELKPWLGESVYNRLAAEVRARKKEGVRMDANVLAIMNAEILACEVGGISASVERGDDPIILLHFMCQQIHCVRKKVSGGEKPGGEGGGGEAGGQVSEEDPSNKTYMDEELGDIVEGSEDDIRANSYVIAFQRVYDEEKMELNWKIVDLRFNGAIAYL
ncbi:hypothetical protein ACHAWF_005683 [Thalassiosira exigua]